MAPQTLLRRQTYCRKYAIYLLLVLSLGCLFYLCFVSTSPIGHDMLDAVWEETDRVDVVERRVTGSRYADRETSPDLWPRNGDHMAISELVHGVHGKFRDILRHGGGHDWERAPGAVNQPAEDYAEDTGAGVSGNKGTPRALWAPIRSAGSAGEDGGADKAAATAAVVVPERYRIPRIIHQTWEDLAIPGQVQDWVRSWKIHHPTWEYWFWTDRGSRHMIHDNFPTKMLSIYADYPYNINRADVRKLLVLYQYGGVFADLDVESLRPIDDLLAEYQCIIAQEPVEHQSLLYENKHSRYVMTAFMACRPRHPFLKFVIDMLPRYANRALTLSWNDNILKSTGPMFLAEVLEQYLNLSSYNGTAEEYVHIAAPDWFMPTFDKVNIETYYKKCGDLTKLPSMQKDVCKKLIARKYKNSVPESAYTNHHWLHTWGYMFVPRGHVSIDQVISNYTKFDS